jgi:hypothetical protein
MSDNYINKLKLEAIEQFKKSIPIFNSDIKAKNSFYYFLFHDLIKIDKSTITNPIDEIIDNSKSIIENNLEEIYDKISNTNPDLLDEFKKNLLKQQSIAKLKIKECDENLLKLKNIYINEYINNYFTINQNSKNFNFDNKKVLVINNSEEDKLVLSEFLTRFLFNLIVLDDIPTSNINNLSDTFYDNINCYYDDISNSIIPFDSICSNFKYWFILLFLIGNIFDKNSQYSNLFNQNEFDKLINDILTQDKKMENKKKEAEKKKKRQTGGTEKKNIGKENPKPNKTVNIVNYKNKYNNLFKNVDAKSGPPYVNKKLYDIYINPDFNNNMRDYFYFYNILPPHPPFTFNSSFKNPFNSTSSISIDKLLPNLNKTIPSTTLPANKVNYIDDIIKIDISGNKFKFDIYESLHMLKDINNKSEINDYLKKLKKKLILLLFFLYSIKKDVYQEYNDTVIDIFHLEVINNESENKNKNKNKNKQNSNTKKESNKEEEINISLLTNNQREIKKLQNEKKKLQNKYDITSDLRKLEIDKNIKRILINGYK